MNFRESGISAHAGGCLPHNSIAPVKFPKVQSPQAVSLLQKHLFPQDESDGAAGSAERKAVYHNRPSGRKGTPKDGRPLRQSSCRLLMSAAAPGLRHNMVCARVAVRITAEAKDCNRGNAKGTGGRIDTVASKIDPAHAVLSLRSGVHFAQSCAEGATHLKLVLLPFLVQRPRKGERLASPAAGKCIGFQHQQHQQHWQRQCQQQCQQH